jgi:hypothetical protein
LVVLTLLVPVTGSSAADAGASPLPDHRGRWFLGLTNLAGFQPATSPIPETTVLLSPVVRVPIGWTELVVSWNAALTSGQWLRLEAAPGEVDTDTRFYSFGTWSLDSTQPERTSIGGQEDQGGAMQTDTLVLKEPAAHACLQLTLGGGATTNQIRFIGLSFLGPCADTTILPPNRSVWGRILEVPERSQMDYEHGDQICSPTTVSMLLAYWATRLNRAELEVDVPQVCAAVHDPGWRGWGNWSFNMAYAGSFPGMRAYVTRLGDLAEVEAWIAAGIPIGLSVCYNKLRGKSEEPSGHLIICVGFTPEGEVVVNDGGTRRNIRKTFSREAVQRAWANSKNTVYLVYPEGAALPEDPHQHWERPGAPRTSAR